MFRTLATLIVAGVIAPAALFAAGLNPTDKTTGAKTVASTKTAAVTKTVTPAKVDVNKAKTVTPAKVDVNKTTTVAKTVKVDTKFPKLNTSYQPKVSQATIAKYTPKSFDKNYHFNHGTKFAHGYCYHGKNHHHWSFCCWDSHCGCHTYWCPCTCCFYYFCEPMGCFYPVTYCPYQTYCWPSCYVVPAIVVVPCDCCGCQ